MLNLRAERDNAENQRKKRIEELVDEAIVSTINYNIEEIKKHNLNNRTWTWLTRFYFEFADKEKCLENSVREKVFTYIIVEGLKKELPDLKIVVCGDHGFDLHESKQYIVESDDGRVLRTGRLYKLDWEDC